MATYNAPTHPKPTMAFHVFPHAGETNTGMLGSGKPRIDCVCASLTEALLSAAPVLAQMGKIWHTTNLAT